MAPAYAAGFRSLEDERRGMDLDVEGRLPGWLDGSLIRNGPAKFEIGGERVAHWFDGLAMLRRFALRDGGVAYTNRFLRSREYLAASGDGRMARDQFGTTRGVLAALRGLLLPSSTDNANVSVVRIDGRFVAITETPVGIEFDPVTLETVGRFRFDDLDGQTMTAHPHVDPTRRETVTLSTEFGRTGRYHLYRLPDGGERFRPIGSVTVDRPSYLHSFGLTARYVVLAEFPLRASPFDLLRPGGGAFIERFRWRPDEGTRFLVVDRDTGEVAADPVGEPFFAFHHVNAFEDEESIVVDVAAFDDPSVIDALYLEGLESGFPALDGELRRYRLPLSGEPVESETLHGGGVTLPRVSPLRNARPYRYVYGQEPPGTSTSTPPRLVKVDVQGGGAVAWAEPDVYPGEPVFVPRPGADGEDDGVVLSVVLDAGRDRSSLLALDGASFEEVARAPLPHVVPFDFHGRFFPGA